MERNKNAETANIISFPSIESSVSTDGRSILDWAKYYVLELGFSVIPIRYKGKIPAVGSWTEFQKRKPTLKELDDWFSNGNKNIGVITGSISGITVVDADTEEAVQYCESNGLADALRVKSSKGYHYYCQHVDGLGCGQDILNNKKIQIDLRGEGGYIIAPPSIHETGVKYEWKGN